MTDEHNGPGEAEEDFKIEQNQNALLLIVTEPSINAAVEEESEDDGDLCGAQTSFSLALMTKLAKKCSVDSSSIPTEPFCALLDSIVLLLQGMGSMMSTAFSDVADKSIIMRKNKAFLI